MVLRFAVVLILTTSLVISVLASSGPCSKLQIGIAKKKYDLTALEGKSFTGITGQYTFNWGVCSSITCNGKSTGVCQTMDGGPGGPIPVAPWDPNNVVTIPVKGGYGEGIGLVYQDPVFERKVNIFVLCDKKAKEATNLRAVFTPGSLSETDLLLSHVAGCGIGSKLSAGSIMLIVLTVCLVLYFILGFLWKRFKQEKQGFDAVPNFLWKDLPGLVADGFRFLVSKTCGRNSSNEGYSQM